MVRLSVIVWYFRSLFSDSDDDGGIISAPAGREVRVAAAVGGSKVGEDQDVRCTAW